MEELVYAGTEVEELIRKKYPGAVLKDASDYIHTERFELTIPEVTQDEFYPFAIKEGFAECCFGFALMLASLKFPEFKDGRLKHEDTSAKIQKWIDLAKGLA